MQPPQPTTICHTRLVGQANTTKMARAHTTKGYCCVFSSSAWTNPLEPSNPQQQSLYPLINSDKSCVFDTLNMGVSAIGYYLNLATHIYIWVRCAVFRCVDRFRTHVIQGSEKTTQTLILWLSHICHILWKQQQQQQQQRRHGYDFCQRTGPFGLDPRRELGKVPTGLQGLEDRITSEP